MNLKLVVLYIVLISFLGMTGYSLAVTEEGFFEWARGLMMVPATAQVVVDLYIACGLILIWMFYDSRSRGKPFAYWLAFAVFTVFAASIGPLLYLILREHQLHGNAAIST